jgi:hypothetical protein
MITYKSLSSDLRSLGEEKSLTYAEMNPFPHISIDEFFDAEVLEKVLAEVNVVDLARSTGKFLNQKTDHNKFTFEPEAVGEQTNRLVTFLNSGPFIQYIEKLTGIDNLIADPANYGGGLHSIENGGFLEVHSDFNHHKKYYLERRVNLLLYLNKDWKEEYNGALELWHSETKTKSLEIHPLFNRCVIFSTTKQSLHGHPVPLATPPGVARRSIALYYYTNTWDKNSDEYNNTIYYLSQNNKVKRKPARVARDLILDLTPPILRKAVRTVRRAIRGEKLTEL